MLTREGCLSRRRRLWESVPGDVEWLLVADPRHVQYLGNFLVQPMSFSGGERGMLLLERNGRASLLGDNFALRTGIHEPYVDREIVETWYDHRRSVMNRDHVLLNALQRIAGELAGRRGLIEAEWAPAGVLSVLPEAGLASAVIAPAESSAAARDLGSILRGLRRRKEPDELALLKHSVRAGEAGHARLREILRPGISELELFREVQSAACAAAGRAVVIYGDFRATNGEHPKVGGLPTDYRLREGDLYILDYSVVVDGYRADFTNTQAVGAPSAELRELFALCEAAMAAGERTLRSGARAADVHAAVMSPFRAAGREAAFPHHAGHGLGLAHPEPPILVPDSTDVLQAGDVVTLEPGAYVPGVGGMRIEHNYLITDTGFDRLTNHTIRLT